MKNETMTALERINCAVSFQEADRVPVAPFIFFHVPRMTGITMREFLFDFRKARRATRQAYEIYGGVDMITWFPTAGYIYHGAEQFFCKWRIKENELPQMVEYPRIKPSDYDKIRKVGILPYLRKPPQLTWNQGWRYLAALKVFRDEIAYWQNKRKVAFYTGGAVMMPFELLSWLRSLQPFLVDLHRYPDKIRRACNYLADGLVAFIETIADLTGCKRILIDGNRASASFISPKIFERVTLPSLKKMVTQIIKDGYDILFHLDTDWLPMLPYFKEFPKGNYIVELEETDIYKAKKVLYGHMCVKGNLSSTLLKLGTKKEIEREVRQLLDKLAPGGGFILGSGCEVPFDAPLENVRCMIQTVKKYGWYA